MATKRWARTRAAQAIRSEECWLLDLRRGRFVHSFPAYDQAARELPTGRELAIMRQVTTLWWRAEGDVARHRRCGAFFQEWPTISFFGWRSRFESIAGREGPTCRTGAAHRRCTPENRMMTTRPWRPLALQPVWSESMRANKTQLPTPRRWRRISPRHRADAAPL